MSRRRLPRRITGADVPAPRLTVESWAERARGLVAPAVEPVDGRLAFMREVEPDDLFPPLAQRRRSFLLDGSGPCSVFITHGDEPPRLLGHTVAPAVLTTGYDTMRDRVTYSTMRWDRDGRATLTATGTVEDPDLLADIAEAARQLRERAIRGPRFVPFPGWTLHPDAVELARAEGIDPARFMDAALGEPWPTGQGTPWDEPRTYSTEELLGVLRQVREELKPAEDEPAAIVVLEAGGHAVVTLLPKATEETTAMLFGDGQAHQVEEFRRMHPGRALLVLGSDAYREWMKGIPVVKGDARSLHSTGLPVYHTHLE